VVRTQIVENKLLCIRNTVSITYFRQGGSQRCGIVKIVIGLWGCLQVHNDHIHCALYWYVIYRYARVNTRDVNDDVASIRFETRLETGDYILGKLLGGRPNLKQR
jgi:hypothetical protein